MRYSNRIFNISASFESIKICRVIEWIFFTHMASHPCPFILGVPNSSLTRNLVYKCERYLRNSGTNISNVSNIEQHNPLWQNISHSKHELWRCSIKALNWTSWVCGIGCQWSGHWHPISLISCYATPVTRTLQYMCGSIGVARYSFIYITYIIYLALEFVYCVR